MLGERVEDFSLRNLTGREIALSDYAERPIVVVAFLGYECPLAKLYAPRLERLASEYASRGVAVLGINANQQDTIQELAHYQRLHGITFPLLKDVGNVVADQFGAERTPEVFVLDRQRQIRYRGRIDDQFGIGYQRRAPQQRFLEQAIDELLAGRDVSVPETDAQGCHIGRLRTPDPEAEVTWSNQISRLFQERCQACHRPGEIGPFSLLSYDDAVGWQEMIREVVLQRRMPPWHAHPDYGEFKNDSRLSDEEIALIETWVEHGAPEGDPANAPPPREWVDGWPFGEPDEVVYMSDEAHTVPADAPAEYKYFFVDPGWEEGRWIKASWCRPGNPAVVHHINVYFRPPWQSWNEWRGGMVNLISGFLPGQSTDMTEFDGTALYVPAGSELVFEQHYTPNGTEETDLSALGLQFATPDEVEREALHVAAYNDQFVIPPYESHHMVEASYTFDRDAEIVFYCPHMHLRGKDFSYEAHYPDGTREMLMQVVGYDYNWQTVYWTKIRTPIPKGTRIDCVARYDNSEDNLSNPDPTREVHWSGFTEDEMMVGVLGLALPLVDGQPSEGEPPPEARLMPASGSDGHLAFDRGFFLQNRTDYKTAFAYYEQAIDEYWATGNYLGIAKVALVKLLVYAQKYGAWVLGYLMAINLLALAIWAYSRWRGGFDVWRLPQRLLQLAALAGGTPAAWLGQLLFGRGNTPRSSRLRLGWIVTTQFVLLCAVVWFVVQRT